MASVPWYSGQVGKTSRMPDLANKSLGHPVKFEFQINFLSISMS